MANGDTVFSSVSDVFRHVASIYMFQVFQLFYMYVSSVSYGCCKSRLGCCIGCMRMLQAHVSSVFSDVYMLQVCLSRCCICFTHMLQVFYLHVAYVCNGF
jgi:hypothetical protein